MEVYQQTTEYTCAATSLLIVLHHFKGVPLTKEQEFNIWLKSANLPVRASSVYGLAIIAKDHGLNPRIVLEEKEYDYPDYRFKGYTKVEIDEAKYSSKLYAKQAREKGIVIKEHEIGLKDVLSTLDKGKIMILRINAGALRDTKSTSKYVVVYKEGDDLMVVDPRKGLINIDENILQEAMITLQTKKKRDVRMIVFD